MQIPRAPLIPSTAPLPPGPPLSSILYPFYSHGPTRDTEGGSQAKHLDQVGVRGKMSSPKPSQTCFSTSFQQDVQVFPLSPGRSHRSSFSVRPTGVGTAHPSRCFPANRAERIPQNAGTAAGNAARALSRDTRPGEPRVPGQARGTQQRSVSGGGRSGADPARSPLPPLRSGSRPFSAAAAPERIAPVLRCRRSGADPARSPLPPLRSGSR
ncbi:hypothetical protein DV515_00018659, partial [Chloebia gouldiae]